MDSWKHLGHTGQPEVAVEQIIKDLMQISAFKVELGRDGHPTFPDFPSNLLHALDYRELHSWMNGLLKTWLIIVLCAHNK